jgi:hypothetical protein
MSVRKTSKQQPRVTPIVAAVVRRYKLRAMNNDRETEASLASVIDVLKSVYAEHLCESA